MWYHTIMFVNTSNMRFTWVSMHILQHNTIYIVVCKLTFSKIRYFPQICQGKIGNIGEIPVFPPDFLKKSVYKKQYILYYGVICACLPM